MVGIGTEIGRTIGKAFQKHDGYKDDFIETEETSDISLVNISQVDVLDGYKVSKKYITGCSIQDLSKNVVSIYNFKGNAEDELDLYDAESIDGAVLTTNHLGSSNRAYSFDGIDDGIQFADGAFRDMQVGSFSVYFYLPNEVNTGSDNQAIFSVDERHQIQFGNDGGGGYKGELLVEYYDGAWNYIRTNQTTWDAGWYHAVTTFNEVSGQRNLYVNGSLMGSVIDATEIQYASGRNASAGIHYNGRLAFEGKISHIMVTNKEFTADEVSELYTHLQSNDEVNILPFVIGHPVQGNIDAGRGLIGVWEADNTDLDSQNKYYPSSSLPSFTTGLNGNAFDFSGGNGLKIDYLASLATPATTNEFTVSGWVNLDSISDGYLKTIFNIGNNEHYGCWLAIDNRSGNNKIWFEVGDGNPSNYYQTNGNYSFTSGEWYHVIGLYDGTNSKVYVNGNLVDSTSPSISLVYNTNAMTIGSYGTSSYPMYGAIDQVTYWDRALSESEISQLYNDGNGVVYPMHPLFGLSLDGNYCGSEVLIDTTTTL